MKDHEPDLRSPVERPGERRLLTVLICDVVNSTGLAETLGADDYADLMEEYRRACVDIVESHGGFVATIQGDGIIVYFGLPQAREDDARRAMRCGLAILNHFSQAPHFGGSYSISLEVRLGVHTGRAVIVPIENDTGRTFLARGLNSVVQRIQAAAVSGTMVSTDAAWKLVQPFFVGESLGEIVLKDADSSVRLWRIDGISGAATRLDGVGALTPYVGRDVEHSALAADWSAVKSGNSRFVVVRGEPGIGKSRLVEEFRRAIVEDEVDVLEMRCTPDTEDSAFLPVIELVARRLGLARSMSVKERLDRIDERLEEIGITVADAAPLLAGLLSIDTGDRYPRLALSPVRRRMRTLEVLIAAVEAFASRQCTLLIAEDLHWADPSTLEFLELLVSSAPRVPVLGLFTARPEFSPAWSGLPGTGLIEASRLDAPAVEAIMRSAAKGTTLPDAVRREIVSRCDGIPLFVEELTRTVIESGVLEEHAHSWDSEQALPEGLLPASLRAALRERIDRLGEAKATAQLAATIGREIPYSLIKLVSERAEDTLRADLDRIVGASLLSNRGSGTQETYVFKHALIREEAYESLRPGVQHRFHERVARALRDAFPQIVSEQPELIAHHLAQAGKDDEALIFWEKAAERALARNDMFEAAAHLRHAIQTIARLPQEPRWLQHELDLQNMMGPVMMTVHGWGATQVRAACQRAQDLAVQLDRPDKLYPAAWGLWTNTFVRGEMDKAGTVGRSLRNLADASGIPMLRMSSHHAMSYTHLYRAEFAETLSEADAGLKLFNVEQERELAAIFQLSSAVCLHTTHATALWMVGRIHESIAAREAILGIARELNHPPSLAAALAFDLYEGLSGGWQPMELERRIKTTDELLKLSKEEGFNLWHSMGRVMRGTAAAAEGMPVTADREMLDGMAEFVRSGSRLTVVGMMVLCAQARVLLGEPDRAWNLLDDAQSEVDARGERLWEPEIDRVRATLLLRRGDSDGAEVSLRRAIAKAKKQNAVSLETRAVLDHAELLERSGQAGAALSAVTEMVHPAVRNSRQPEAARGVATALATADSLA